MPSASSAGISRNDSHSSSVPMASRSRRSSVIDPSSLHLVRAAYDQIGVDQPRSEARVLDLLDDLAGGEIDAVDVVQLRVVGVEPDQHGVRVPAVVAEDLRLHLLTRGQQLGLTGLEVEQVEPPVLVAGGVLRVHQVPVVVQEQVAADPAVGVIGDRPRLGAAVGRTDPDVQHAIARGDVGDLGAVRRQRRSHLVGVAEQHVARDQGREAGLIHHGSDLIRSTADLGVASPYAAAMTSAVPPMPPTDAEVYSVPYRADRSNRSATLSTGLGMASAVLATLLALVLSGVAWWVALGTALAPARW